MHTGGGLGDVLLSGPVVDTLHHSGYKVDFLARKGTSGAVERHPRVNELLTIDTKDPPNLGEMKSWAARLKEREYDICLLLWSTTRWAWTLFWSRIPKRVGQASRLAYSFLFTHRVPIRSERGDTSTHWTEILLDYPRRAGLQPVEPKLSYPLTEKARKEASGLIERFDFGELQGPLLGFHSGKGLPLTANRWPVAQFARLAEHLQANLGARLILTGGPNEVEIVNEIQQRLLLPVANVAGKTSLETLGALAEQCSAFVCPDSGPMHLAAAVGTPVVGIYALDEDFPKRWAPFGTDYRIIRPPRPACPPGCKKPTCPNFACYLKVKPEEVTRAVEELLGHGQESPKPLRNRQPL